MPSTFYPVRDVIVKGALRLVNAYPSNDNPRPEQMQDATEACNLMLKSWQVEGFLWLKKFALLTLTPGKATYLLGNDVNGNPSADICVYTSPAVQIDRPTRISHAAYRAAGFDRPMHKMSRDEYIQLTNKTSPAPSTQFYYNPQLYQGELTVWPIPTTADTLFLSCDRGIYDLINDTDTYDIPQEWLRIAKWGLATEIAQEYAVPASQLAQIEAKYQGMKQTIDSYDRETSDTQIMVGR
jgi:hypothetical protein